MFASTLILLGSLKLNIYVIYCQLSRYLFCKSMLTIISQCHKSVPCVTRITQHQKSSLRPHPSDFRLPTSDFRLPTSDLSHQPSDFKLHPSDFIPPNSSLRPQPSDFRPQTSDFIPQTSALRLPTSDFILQTSSNFLQRETKILISSSQSACIDS